MFFFDFCDLFYFSIFCKFFFFKKKIFFDFLRSASVLDGIVDENRRFIFFRRTVGRRVTCVRMCTSCEVMERVADPPVTSLISQKNDGKKAPLERGSKRNTFSLTAHLIQHSLLHDRDHVLVFVSRGCKTIIV